MKLGKRASYAVGSMLLVSALAACGGGSDGDAGEDASSDDTAAEEFASQDAAEIVAASAADMSTLTSVQVTAEIQDDGMTTVLDLQIDADGDCTGTVGLGGAEAEVLSVDGESWFKADETFFSQVLSGPDEVEAVVAAVGGRYIEDAQGQFSSFCSLEDIIDSFTDTDVRGEISTGERAEVEGQDAIIINGKTDDLDDSQAFVATGEKHYVLKFTRDGSSPGEGTFSKFNEELDLEAPAPDDVFDLSTLP